MGTEKEDFMELGHAGRRSFIKQGLILTAGIAGMGLVTACKNQEEDNEGEEEVSPPEDLMREHGLLNRILLIYDFCIAKLNTGADFPLAVMGDAAGIVRHFVEDYHEQLEEKHLFPRFEKANKLTDLVKVLRSQHDAGRNITEQVMNFGKKNKLDAGEQQKLGALLTAFNRMYRPHEAREDTVLFPALRSIVSAHEYDSMGEDFEKKEHELFGKEGFEGMVVKVGELEKQIGLYDLAQFTPAI